MTIGPLSQCDTCARLRPWYATGMPSASCEAFPGGIPTLVWTNGADHRQALVGDHGLRWLSNKGEAFPEWAFPAAAEEPDTAPGDEEPVDAVT